MLEPRSPVPLADLLALYAAAGRRTRRQVNAAILQGARSESVAFYRAGVPLAAFLLYPREDDRFDRREVLFTAAPGAGPHMLEILRFARLRLAALPDDVRLIGTAHSNAGARLFAILGFEPNGKGEWRYGGLRESREFDL